MTPSQASKKIKRKNSRSQSSSNRKKHKLKINLGELVRTADIQKTFSKDESTKWSHQLNTIAIDMILYQSGTMKTC